MNKDTERIGDEAARWHLATLADDCDWDGFTQWLEADPRHARSYDEVSLADDLVRKVEWEFSEPLEADSGAAAYPRRANWPLWGGGAVAASLALALAVSQFAAQPPEVYVAGSTSREIALGDGSHVTLAPDSRLTVAQNDLTIDGGGYFSIRHDPARRMIVHAGELEATDIGTAFDVQTGPAATRIAVAEGKLTVRGAALSTPVELPEGKRIALDRRAHLATVSGVSRGEVGSWRRGQLTFSDAPLSLVVADLKRYARVHALLSPGIERLRFSGTLSIADGRGAIRDLAQVLGLSVTQEGKAFRLRSAD